MLLNFVVTYASLRPYPPWWVHEGGHNDIEVVWRSTFFLKVRGFIEALTTPGKADTLVQKQLE